MRPSLWKSNVNSFLGIIFLGSFALGASLMIWHAATGENPLADRIAAYMVSQNL